MTDLFGLRPYRLKLGCLATPIFLNSLTAELCHTAGKSPAERSQGRPLAKCGNLETSCGHTKGSGCHVSHGLPWNPCAAVFVQSLNRLALAGHPQTCNLLKNSPHLKHLIPTLPNHLAAEGALPARPGDVCCPDRCGQHLMNPGQIQKLRMAVNILKTLECKAVKLSLEYDKGITALASMW